MIIGGKPENGLQKHQQEAYKAVEKAYEQGNNASVVIPTGCGKSFIALQLMADNKDKTMLFLAPTNAIKNQMYNYIAKYIVGEEPTSERPARMIANEYFPHLQIRLYPTLLRVSDKQMEQLNADIIIMDELHRTGADKWGEKVNTLLEKNPNAKVLGLTATPDRMDDKNVVDELFEGKIDYELTLVDALRDGIVKSPTYVKCDYALKEYLEGIKNAITNCKDEQTKKELQDRFDKMRKVVEHADGISELLRKNIKKKDGKYIIFCKDKEHMDELMENVGEWFGTIDSEPEIYSVYSGKGYNEAQNERTIKQFETSKSEHLKLLFSIEKLNEGLHVEDISGVIMARPTDSRIIYLQQLGRALSSDTSREKTIVFDLVNNYIKNNLDAEVNNRTKGTGKSKGGNDGISGIDGGSEPEDIDIFRIQGETFEFLKILEEIQGIADISIYLINARAIKEWIEKSGDTKPPSQKSNDEEEKRLGIALSTIKQNLRKPYMELKTEEEKEEFRKKHPEIDEVMEILNEIDKNNSPYLKNARAIKEWIEKSGDTKPPSQNAKDEEERKLYNALRSIVRNLTNPYKKLELEDEKKEYRENHPEIDEVLEIINEIDSNNISPYLKNARAIREWIKQHGKKPSLESKNTDERNLGNAWISIKQNLLKPYWELKTEEEKEKFRKKHPEIDEVLEIIKEIDDNNISPYLKNARAIKEWIEQNRKKPSSASKNIDEKRLGRDLSNIRSHLIKPYMESKTEEEKEEFRKKHPEIDEVLKIITEIDTQYGTKQQKELAILIRQDLEKRQVLQKAKELEQQYEQELSKIDGKEPKKNENEGVDLDGE